MWISKIEKDYIVSLLEIEKKTFLCVQGFMSSCDGAMDIDRFNRVMDPVRESIKIINTLINKLNNCEYEFDTHDKIYIRNIILSNRTFLSKELGDAEIIEGIDKLLTGIKI